MRLSTGWDCLPLVVESEVDGEPIVEEPRPETNPQRVEHGLRGGVLGVQRSHDVTPYILRRLSEKSAKVQTAAAVLKTKADGKDGAKPTKGEDETKKHSQTDADKELSSEGYWTF